MGILLIDSSAKKIEFGFQKDNELILNETLDSNNNADTLSFHIKSAFDKKHLSFDEIQIISLSNGPGSFTGLRISSAIAKGICFAKGSKLVEIPTLDVIANKYKNPGKVTSLIYSNSRTNEFYFCEYEIESDLFKRVSDYKINYLENIISKEDSIYLINESLGENIPEKFKELVIDVSEFSGINSQCELTKKAIYEAKFSDFKTSQPFYMKDFVPNN